MCVGVGGGGRKGGLWVEWEGGEVGVGLGRRAAGGAPPAPLGRLPLGALGLPCQHDARLSGWAWRGRGPCPSPPPHPTPHPLTHAHTRDYHWSAASHRYCLACYSRWHASHQGCTRLCTRTAQPPSSSTDGHRLVCRSMLLLLLPPRNSAPSPAGPDCPPLTARPPLPLGRACSPRLHLVNHSKGRCPCPPKFNQLFKTQDPPS